MSADDRGLAGHAPRRRVRRALLFLAVLFVIHVGLAFGLDALGFTEALLSSSAPRALLAVILGLVFFASRLLLYFIAPGLVIAALLKGGADRLTKWAAPGSSGSAGSRPPGRRG